MTAQPAVTNYAAAVQDIAAWDSTFSNDPELMFSLIRDVLKIVQAQEVEGPRVGRRPDARRVGFDELWATLVPDRFSVHPVQESLVVLIDGHSHSSFAARAGCARSYITHVVAGRKVPQPDMLERFAAAGVVTPAYFLEWRAWKLSQLMAVALLGDPDATARILKKALRSL